MDPQSEGDAFDYVPAAWLPSPNYWVGRFGLAPRYIVMHGTAGTAQGSLSWLTDPLSAASVHYLIGRDGTVWQLVREDDTAWGNGIPEGDSPFVGGPNPNFESISIEHERPDPQNETPVTEAQRLASIAVVGDIRRRRGPLGVIPHSLISPLSRARCPGAGFPLEDIDRESRLVGGGGVPGPSAGTGGRFPRYLVDVDMKARFAPNVFAWYVPVQLCYRGAVLEGTGRVRGGWIEVVAGGRAVWLLGSNMRRLS